MKKLLVILLLFFVVSCGQPSRATCAKKAEKANTDWVATQIYMHCQGQQYPVTKKKYRCALKAKKAKTEAAAKQIYYACIY